MVSVEPAAFTSFIRVGHWLFCCLKLREGENNEKNIVMRD